MNRDWLQRKFTVAEAEAANAVRDERLGPEPVPFGFLNDEWQELLAQMQPGDELWEFSSPAASWQGLCGRAGVVLLRDRAAIVSIVTCMN